jgi:hypothetical protein
MVAPEISIGTPYSCDASSLSWLPKFSWAEKRKRRSSIYDCRVSQATRVAAIVAHLVSSLELGAVAFGSGLISDCAYG